jgi:hypothetical protein
MRSNARLIRTVIEHSNGAVLLAQKTKKAAYLAALLTEIILPCGLVDP